MSTDSIDQVQTREQQRALTELYTSELLPLAERRLLDGRVAPKADPTVASYYKKRAPKRLETHDFELRLADAQQVAQTLDAFWAGTAFAGLGTKLAALSEKFPEVQQRADVSAFIYEML